MVLIAADWSELTHDLIGEIAKNIGTVEDFVIFSMVCPSWQLAAVKHNWVSGHQFPWLVLAENEDEQDSASRSNQQCRGFFNFSNNRRYDVNIPQLRGCRLWGSSIGWIITLNVDFEFHLVNPLTNEKLSLPHLRSLKHLYGNPTSIQERISFVNSDIIKSLVFKMKNLSNNEEEFMAAVTYFGEHDQYLAMARPGDELWTQVEHGPPYYGIADICYFDGRLFLLRDHGTLLLCQLDQVDEGFQFATIIAGELDEIRLSYKAYLVESMGELLMVARWLDLPQEPYELEYKTTRFMIYKVDFENNRWVTLKCLDSDTALFLGDSYSMSLSSTEVAGCKGNAIYYTDDYLHHRDDSKKDFGAHDTGIFDLNENVFLPLVPNTHLAMDDLRSTFSWPVWMMPSLF